MNGVGKCILALSPNGSASSMGSYCPSSWLGFPKSPEVPSPPGGAVNPGRLCEAEATDCGVKPGTYDGFTEPSCSSSTRAACASYSCSVVVSGGRIEVGQTMKLTQLVVMFLKW